MFLIENKTSGSCQKFDGTLDDAIKSMQSQRTALVLWWIFGDRNDRICEVTPAEPNPSIDRQGIARLGWFNGEYKCPFTGTMFGKNLNGDIPITRVSQHVHQYFALRRLAEDAKRPALAS